MSIDPILAKQYDRTTPSEIAETKFPVQDTYHIRTRVMVEIMILEYTTVNGITKIVMYAAQPEDIINEFLNAEKVFSSVALEFELDQVIFQRYDLPWTRLFMDAWRNPQHLTICYMLPHDFEYEGISSAPWEEFPWGILIGGERDEWTLAHEIGHYFGLLHPFDEDYCEDTPVQNNKICNEEAGKLPNCGNVMNYCIHKPKYITQDQAKRMRRFLRAKRQNNVDLKAVEKKEHLAPLYNAVLKILADDPDFKEVMLTQSSTTQPSETKSNEQSISD